MNSLVFCIKIKVQADDIKNAKLKIFPKLVTTFNALKLPVELTSIKLVKMPANVRITKNLTKKVLIMYEVKILNEKGRKIINRKNITALLKAKTFIFQALLLEKLADYCK